MRRTYNGDERSYHEKLQRKSIDLEFVSFVILIEIAK
jgi:hypothetical protein